MSIAVLVEHLIAEKGATDNSVAISWAYAPQASEYLVRFRLNRTWYEISLVDNDRALTPISGTGTDFSYNAYWSPDAARYVLNVTFSGSLAHPNTPTCFEVTSVTSVLGRIPHTAYAFVTHEVDTVIVFGRIVGVDSYQSRGEGLVLYSYLDANPGLEITAYGGAKQQGTAFVARRNGVVTADAQGVWQARLLRGARVRIRIPAADVDKVVLTPNEAGPVDLSELQHLGDTNVPRATRKR